MFKNFPLIKVSRLAAWVLLVTIVLYFISGYGLSKGIINRQLSAALHQNILPLITLTAFTLHVSISVKFAFMRWRIWNTFSRVILVFVFGLIYLLFLYFQFFYQPQALSPVNNTVSSENLGQTIFTVSELSKYDGQNSHPAYVAVDGVVYDLSSVFINGTHYGYSAGQDLTGAFYSKHIKSQIAKYPVVGVLH